MPNDGKCIWNYYDGKCDCDKCSNCSHYRPEKHKDVSASHLIDVFTDMANRGTLLTGHGVTQHDLLMQIVGTITHVALEN